jgi:hypothetical protein
VEALRRIGGHVSVNERVLALAPGVGSRCRADARHAAGRVNGAAENNAVIMAVLLVVIGVKLIGDAIGGF